MRKVWQMPALIGAAAAGGLSLGLIVDGWPDWLASLLLAWPVLPCWRAWRRCA